MTVSNQNYQASTGMTIRFQNSKNLNQLVPSSASSSSASSLASTAAKSSTQFVEYASDLEEEEEQSSDYGSDMDAVPALVQDEAHDRSSLMRMIVNIVAALLSNKSGCTCCHHNDVNTILLNMLNVTKFNLHNFEKAVVMINSEFTGGECIKYVILSAFIKQSEVDLAIWSKILNIHSGVLEKLTLKYNFDEVCNEDVKVFNGKLLNVIKGNFKVI